MDSGGWEKGQVENQVGLVRKRFFTPRLRVKSYDELNGLLLDRCVALRQGASSPRATRPHRVGDVRGRAAAHLSPTDRFDGFNALPPSVSRTCLVRFDNNKYSVSASAVGRDPGLCRSRGDPPGRPHRRRTSTCVRPRRDDLRSLALRPRLRPQARRCATAEVIGHADRVVPLRDYCLGLLMPLERKSVEPTAAVAAPARPEAKHQSLLHFVGQASWSDEALMARVRSQVMPVIERQGPIRAWIIDDTGFSKKGRHSVGVARQYCGQLGKQDNCQVAVSLSVANEGNYVACTHGKT